MASMGSKAPKTVVPAVQLTKKGRLPSALSFSTRFSNSSGIIRPLKSVFCIWGGMVLFIQRECWQRLGFNPLEYSSKHPLPPKHPSPNSPIWMMHRIVQQIQVESSFEIVKQTNWFSTKFSFVLPVLWTIPVFVFVFVYVFVFTLFVFICALVLVPGIIPVNTISVSNFYLFVFDIIYISCVFVFVRIFVFASAFVFVSVVLALWGIIPAFAASVVVF